MFDITLKNNTEKWENTSAISSLMYLSQYNDLTDCKIIKALHDYCDSKGISEDELHHSENEICNLVYWSFHYDDEINQETDKSIISNLEFSLSQILESILSCDSWAKIVLKQLAKTDNNIILTEL